jgi:asparagine synthase (glutamine-hydrolysing)
MSGICGILHLDGRPIDQSLLEKMTAALDYRGPDARGIWVDRAVGFGHTLLRTTDESAPEKQPYTLDGEIYITADARIDEREELIAQLRDHGEAVKANEPDVNLILHAYRLWGEDCLDRLLGDFAFALWDSRKQHLFCARDPVGVKLFYYARVGHCFIFSNTLNCLRLHPQVSPRLNEQALGDFLLFNINYELNTTIFADIQCLPGGNCLIVTDGQLRQQSYWTLPMPQQIRYRQAKDYIAHFQELMEMAVRDRLRTQKVSIFLSGGLDSTNIALAALNTTQKQNQPFDLQAFTIVYDRLIPDREGHYAGIAAQTLGIPIHYIVADDYQLYQGWDKPELQFPEPLHSPLILILWEKLRQAATHSRVALYGQGGDEALKASTVREMLQGMPLQDIWVDLVRCVFQHHLRPTLGTGLLGAIRQWKSRNQPQRISLPPWLNPDFSQRLNLGDRWQQIRGQPPRFDRPPRSLAYSGLPPNPAWQVNSALYDPGYFGFPLDVRLPFLDLRLLSYLLALPPLPWCVSKEILRAMLRGKLPESIHQRPKSPLAVDPMNVLARRHPQPWPDGAISSKLAPYVDLSTWKEITSSKMDSRQPWESLRPVSLGYWLQQTK